MTKKRVKEILKAKGMLRPNERIIDIQIYKTCSCVDITIVDKQHFIWRQSYDIKGDSLRFTDTKLAHFK